MPCKPCERKRKALAERIKQRDAKGAVDAAVSDVKYALTKRDDGRA